MGPSSLGYVACIDASITPRTTAATSTTTTFPNTRVKIPGSASVN